jgi:hypothetical protein
MEERIMTQHPEGKTGVNLSKRKYHMVRQAIVKALRVHGERSFKELVDDVHGELDGKFDGSIRWYTTTVKLDLEARKVIQRMGEEAPQRLRLVQD